MIFATPPSLTVITRFYFCNWWLSFIPNWQFSIRHLNQTVQYLDSGVGFPLKSDILTGKVEGNNKFEQNTSNLNRGSKRFKFNQVKKCIFWWTKKIWSTRTPMQFIFFIFTRTIARKRLWQENFSYRYHLLMTPNYCS